jgi:hypothetical protein
MALSVVSEKGEVGDVLVGLVVKDGIKGVDGFVGFVGCLRGCKDRSCYAWPGW